jgi:ribosome-binding protein aMBF1 (putative translation factor)
MPIPGQLSAQINSALAASAYFAIVSNAWRLPCRQSVTPHMLAAAHQSTRIVTDRLQIDCRHGRWKASVDIRARLGSNVRRLREAKGWSQEDYVDRAGIHRTYVSDIERGKRNPAVSVVAKLAKPLEIEPGRLLD